MTILCHRQDIIGNAECASWLEIHTVIGAKGINVISRLWGKWIYIHAGGLSDHRSYHFKIHGPRKNGDGKTQAVVLACRRCNNERGVTESQKLYLAHTMEICVIPDFHCDGLGNA